MASANIELRPFPIPSAVYIELPSVNPADVPANAPQIKLEDLSDETLAALCDEFTASVFAAAGRNL